QMGYEKTSIKVTFYKAFFSSQWKFFIHTLLQSLCAKRTSWNEFSTTMASAGVEFPTHFQQVLDTCSALTRRVENLEHDNAAQKLEIIKLKARVKRLERVNKVKSSKLRRLRKDDSKVQEVVEVVTTAKLIIDVVTAASQVSAASATISAAKPTIPAAAPTVVVAYTRRRKRVIIRDPEEELSLKTLVETPKLKNKGKGILIETPKPMKKKDQIELDTEYARKLHEEINKDHEEINKDIDWDAAIDHMDFFKGMSYDEICLIFQARFDANMRFMFKSREEMEEEDQEVLKSINKTPTQKAAKRRKLNKKDQEAEDLKKRLELRIKNEIKLVEQRRKLNV
nr:hypothetical protein [Tanacetum cinerariifolium]